ncbi:hypothetical protein M407DRAFT_22787 [Tulasnella calospora MUT 4182]|uniref:Uncharacterized protein n=1 Tax=Tulasnella calospora MUT 4182 TaxID=1051891 RepID=A0A0C3M2U1_9AGAM|nr:hypothetical protein M407DRAFT_22787 [Tulasnella calospora MUT 4182]
MSNTIKHRRGPQSSRGPSRLPRQGTNRKNRNHPGAQERQTENLSKIVRDGQDPIRQLYAGGARQETKASSEASTGQPSPDPAAASGNPNEGQSGQDIRAQYNSYHEVQPADGGNGGDGDSYAATDGVDAYPDGTASEAAPSTTEQVPAFQTASGPGSFSTVQPTSYPSHKSIDNPVLEVPEKSESQDAFTSSEATASTATVTAPSNIGGGRPTTMVPNTTLHSTSTLTSVPVSPGTPLSQPPPPILPHLGSYSRSSTEPIETGLFDGNPSSSSESSSSSSGKAIGITAAFLTIAFIVVVVYLRRRAAALKARADRERFAELQRDFLATKESSIFGGPDRGSMSLDEKRLPTGPSWDDSFLNYLPPPSPVPFGTQQHNKGPHGRISTRGSGWMVIGEKSPVLGAEAAAAEGRIPPPPNVHFTDGRAPRKGFETELQSASSVSTVEDAVIRTASRVSAASVYTTQSTRKPPTAYKNISPYGQKHLDPKFAISKVPAAQQHTNLRQDAHNATAQANVSRASGAPPNTAIGRGILKERNGTNGDTNKENLPSPPMAPLRINKKSNIIAPTPTKPPHTSIISSYAEDDDDSSDPFEHDQPSGRGNPQTAHRYHYQKRQSVYSTHSSVGFNPSQSMGELMLAPYGDEALVSDVEGIGGGERSGGTRSERGNRSEDWATHSAGNKPKVHPQHRQPVQPRSTTPRLTVTSPSGALSGLTPSASTSSMEDAFMSLSQMALASSQPDYRSPTYSIYNMYDGDDEAGLPRRSIPVPVRR